MPDFKDRLLLDDLAPFRRQTNDSGVSWSLIDVFHKLIQSILTSLCLALNLVIVRVSTPPRDTILSSPLACKVPETDSLYRATVGDKVDPLH